MRVITSVYLHLGMRGLRDEWLSGGDVDAVVEEAVPVECAWRGLVGWWHLRRYRDVVEGLEVGGKESDGADQENNGDGKEEDPYDFFARELEKMGWGVDGVGNAGADDEDDEEDGVDGMLGGRDEGASEWEGGVLRGEG